MKLHSEVVEVVGFSHGWCEFCEVAEDWLLMVGIVYEVEAENDDEDDSGPPSYALEGMCFGCFRHLGERGI